MFFERESRMIRVFTRIALFELALLGALLGVPTAQADPTDECCGEPRHEECRGCVGNYDVGADGQLFGCITTGVPMGCDMLQLTCATIVGPAQRWRTGSNCTIPDGVLLGEADILRQGCTPTECN
jgi:hypothetical protein